MIDRRTIFLGSIATIVGALFGSNGTARADVLTPRDKEDLSRIETYLNSLRTLKARFLQVAPDGRITEGSAWLERPGRMRFEYDKPAPFLLVASHGILVFDDSALRQTSTIPLSRTPLGILLGDRVAFSGDVTVTGVERLPGEIQVGVTRTSSPGEGSLTLIFADAPLALRQWSVIDAQRRETHVSLFNIEVGGKFDPKLFDDMPKPRADSPGGG